MKKVYMVGSLVLGVFVFAGCCQIYDKCNESGNTQLANEVETKTKEGNLTPLTAEYDVYVYQYFGNLLNVDNGDSLGQVRTAFDGSYKLYATFERLPDPGDGDFYEGWIVKKNPTSVLSTGKAEKVSGQYYNYYTNEKDLNDHDFYVLTLEPDDGDPAPAKHILEGTIKGARPSN
ncbi:hypothetical protein KKH43_00025 [Patescibacteria group bacterium]|nr:hypothetical protein [Patescibacteria group bacterium]